MMVANDVTNGAVFDQESNDVIIVSASSVTKSQGTKLEVANAILTETAKLLRAS
jgi:hypothetical protein